MRCPAVVGGDIYRRADFTWRTDYTICVARSIADGFFMCGHLDENV
jgi:hypothetical protein